MSFIFTTMFKHLRGDLDYNAEISYFKNFIKKEIGKFPDVILDLAEIGAKITPLSLLG